MKKIILAFLFLLLGFSTQAHAVVTYYLCGNSAGGNWNSTSIWTTIIGDISTCSGGTGNYPGSVSTDVAILNSSSGNVTNNGTYSFATLNESGYTGTLAMSTYTMTMSGLCTLQGAMTNTSGTLVCDGVTLGSTVTGSWPNIVMTAGTFTPAGFTWGGNLINNSFGTTTLAGTTIISGTCSNDCNAGEGWTGANMTCGNLQVSYCNNGNTSGPTFKFTGGDTLTVTNSLYINGQALSNITGLPAQSVLVFESTNTTPINLDYTGTLANINVSNTKFNYVTANGSPILNYNGSSSSANNTSITNYNQTQMGLAVGS